MQVHIDWLSFTFPISTDDQTESHHLFQLIEADLDDLLGGQVDYIFDGQIFIVQNGRAPYSISWRREDSGVTIFAHPKLPHALVEITGRGCEAISAREDGANLLEAIKTRLTRLDVACDMLTDTRPDQFTAHRREGRFQAWSEVQSESGHTIYVGSRHSDRYARVYRYNAPHPRSHLLRSEFVLKAELAKVTCQQILDLGIIHTAAALGNTFGWQHEDWQPGSNTEAESRSWSPERRSGKTVSWVHRQVIPALVKLHRSGVIDLRTLFSETILPEIEGDE